MCIVNGVLLLVCDDVGVGGCICDVAMCVYYTVQMILILS